jgi:hypothetical protein
VFSLLGSSLGASVPVVKKPLFFKKPLVGKAPLVRVDPKKLAPKVYSVVLPAVPLQRQLFVLPPPVAVVSNKSVSVPVKPIVPLFQKIALSQIQNVSRSNVMSQASSSDRSGNIVIAASRSNSFQFILSDRKVVDSQFDYSVKHPVTGEVARGLRGNPDKIAWTQHLTRSQYLMQGEADTQAFIFNAVVANTKSTYASAQRPYIRYCNFMGTNPILTIIPIEWYETAPHANSFPITILSNYLSYLVNDNEGKPVSGSSAGNYLSAARKLIEDQGQCVLFMKDNPVLKAVKKGIKNEWVAIPGNSRAETALYAVSIDMIEHGKNELLHVETSLEDLGVYTEQVIAHGHINRSSEVIWCPKTSHHLRTKGVHFYLMPNEGDVYTGENYPDHPLIVEASMMDNYPDERVAGHNLFLINSKTDRYGKGYANPGKRKLVLPPEAVYDMTSVLLHWYRKAHPLRDDPFLSSPSLVRNGEKLVIVRAHLNRFHNRLAELYGLDPKRVNTHSTRFGGASAMKAAGFSDSTIMWMGRWSSLCFLKYLHETIKTRYAVAEALANREMFTITDSLLLNSASAYMV